MKPQEWTNGTPTIPWFHFQALAILESASQKGKLLTTASVMFQSPTVIVQYQDHCRHWDVKALKPSPDLTNLHHYLLHSICLTHYSTNSHPRTLFWVSLLPLQINGMHSIQLELTISCNHIKRTKELKALTLPTLLVSVQLFCSSIPRTTPPDAQKR